MKKSIKQRLLELRPLLIQEAQYLYDSWNQDDEGFDDSSGSGGVCCDIAFKKILKKHGLRATIGQTESFKDDHAFLKVGSFIIDLSANKYEKLKTVKKGWLRGQKHWFKKPGIKLKSADIILQKRRYKISATQLRLF